MPSDLMDKEIGREVLLEVAGVLDEMGVPFFLMQGTALGAYRDGGFVPLERDIDFGVLIEHFGPAAGELADRLESIEYGIRKIVEPFTVARTIVAAKSGVKVDIVGFMLWKDDTRFTATPLDEFSVGPRPWAILHRREFLENYETVEMFGHPFNVPSPIEDYLESEYGPDWRTPKDDHISRGRVYHFIRDNNLPADFVERQIRSQ